MAPPAITRLAFAAALVAAAVSAEVWHMAALNMNDPDQLKLEWKFDATTVTFKYTVKNKGNWFAMGFNNKVDMAGADMLICQPTSASSLDCADYHAVGKVKPVKDQQQDAIVESATVNGDSSTVTWSRKRDLCNNGEDYPLTAAATVRVIYAIGENSGTLGYHGSGIAFRGGVSIDLFDPIVAKPSSASSWDILNSGSFSERTWYPCFMSQVPADIGADQQIYGFKPTGAKGDGVSMLHHILVYTCTPDDSSDSAQINFDGQCMSSQNMNKPPPGIRHCRSAPIVLWAIGADESFYPSDAGVDISPNQYLFVEYHLDNPSGTPTTYQDIGIKIFYGPKRANSIGVLQVGHEVDPTTMVIPPNQQGFDIQAYCPLKCISDHVDKTVFGVALHGHLTTVSVGLTVVNSQGVETALDVNPSYDFNYQTINRLQSPYKPQMGDTFRLQCRHRTTTEHANAVRALGYTVDYDTKAVIAGEGTTDEMCLAYVFYYPAVPEAKDERCWGSADVKGFDFTNPGFQKLVLAASGDKKAAKDYGDIFSDKNRFYNGACENEYKGGMFQAPRITAPLKQHTCARFPPPSAKPTGRICKDDVNEWVSAMDYLNRFADFASYAALKSCDEVKGAFGGCAPPSDPSLAWAHRLFMTACPVMCGECRPKAANHIFKLELKSPATDYNLEQLKSYIYGITAIKVNVKLSEDRKQLDITYDDTDGAYNEILTSAFTDANMEAAASASGMQIGIPSSAHVPRSLALLPFALAALALLVML